MIAGCEVRDRLVEVVDRHLVQHVNDFDRMGRENPALRVVPMGLLKLLQRPSSRYISLKRTEIEFFFSRT